MRTIVDQACDIILGHLWKLLLKDALQPGENDETIPRAIIIDHSKLDFTSSLF